MTAFVPGFQHDLFISYAHEDDKRWIQAFEDELRDEISRRLGMGISVWQDTSRIRAGENWQVAIQEGIEGAAAFVAVVSPRYQNSQWCARERNEFRKRFKAEEFDDQRPLLQGGQDAMVRECPPSFSAGNPGRRFLQGRR